MAGAAISWWKIRLQVALFGLLKDSPAAGGKSLHTKHKFPPIQHCK
jgi:hypothetical protein